MSAKDKKTKYIKNQVPDEERCLFTTNNGNRCRNPHLGNASAHCFLHEGRMAKVDEAEAQAVAAQLLAGDALMRTKDDVNRFTSQLLTLVAEKKVSRQDGSLMAYIASVLLQTIAPVRRKPVVEQREEFVESVAAPIREERVELFPRHNAGPAAGEAGTLGRNNNPYLHSGRWK